MNPIALKLKPSVPINVTKQQRVQDLTLWEAVLLGIAPMRGLPFVSAGKRLQQLVSCKVLAAGRAEDISLKQNVGSTENLAHDFPVSSGNLHVNEAHQHLLRQRGVQVKLAQVTIRKLHEASRGRRVVAVGRFLQHV